MQKGFTLIEVLVVVLIIGILTSVALPQYQKAVMRARFANLVQINKAIVDAQIVYYDTYNKYADTMEELDVQFSDMKDITCNVNYFQAVLCTSNGKPSMAIMQWPSDNSKKCYSYAPFTADFLCSQEMNNSSFVTDCGGGCHLYTQKK